MSESQVSSTTTDEDSVPDSPHRDIRRITRALLRDQVFQATFLEKRYVEPLNAYRNVILINNDEKSVIRGLLDVKRRIRALAPHDKPRWVGITEPGTVVGAPSKGFCLWVTLPEELLGRFLFSFKSLEIDINEARVRVQRLRPVIDASPSSPHTETLNGSQDMREVFHNFVEYTMKPMMTDFTVEMGNSMRRGITFQNTTQIVKSIILGIIALIAALFEIARFLLEYMLKLMSEITRFIKVTMPVWMGLVDVLKYIIYGFYYTIVTLFSQKKPGPIHPQYAISDGSRLVRYKSLPYREARHSRGPVITEIE